MNNYNYSRIEYLRVKNFGCLGDIEVTFDKPILQLTGANDVGKSAIVKALGIVATNDMPTKQKSWIKDGTAGFGIEIKLEDGTKVIRMKTKNKNIIAVEKEENKWSTDKIDVGYGTPKEVQEVMGIVEEPETKELLQIRTYEEQLMFATTQTSTNYKVMRNALKVEQIAKGIQVGASILADTRAEVEANNFVIREHNRNIAKLKIINTIKIEQINKELIEKTSLLERLEGLQNQKNKIEIIKQKVKQQEPIKYIEEINEILFNKVIDLKSKKDLIESINNRIKKLEVVRAMIEINETLTHKLTSGIDRKVRVVNLQKKVENIKKIEGLQELSESIITKILKANEYRDKINTLRVQTQKILPIENLEEVNEVVVNKVLNLIKLKNLLSDKKSIIENQGSLNKLQEIEIQKLEKITRLIELKNIIQDLEMKVEVGNSKIMELREKMANIGIEDLIECDNCGNFVILEVYGEQLYCTTEKMIKTI